MESVKQELFVDTEAEIHIDISLIPKRKQEALASACLDMVKNILNSPGGREMLDKKIEELGL